MKEVTKEALHGFSGISTTELQTIDGGGKFAFIKNGVSYSTGSWEVSVTASIDSGFSSTWHNTPSISSGNGSIISAAYGPVYGEVKSISVGITYHY